MLAQRLEPFATSDASDHGILLAFFMASGTCLFLGRFYYILCFFGAGVVVVVTFGMRATFGTGVVVVVNCIVVPKTKGQMKD